MTNTRTLAIGKLLVLASLTLVFSFSAGVLTLSDIVFFRPVLTPEPDKVLFILGLTRPSGVDVAAWWGQARTMRSLSMYRSGSLSIGSEGEESATITVTTKGFFKTFAPPVLTGRLFSDEDSWDQLSQEAVVSYGFWNSRLKGTPIDRAKLVLGGKQYSVVGVCGRDFSFPGSTDVWLYEREPFNSSAPQVSRNPDLQLFEREGWVGRLAEGATVFQARSEFQRLLAELQKRQQSSKVNVGSFVNVRTVTDAASRHAKPAALLILGATLALLITGILNASMFFLYESLSLQKELAIRTALGATWSRLAWQQLSRIGSVVLAAVVAGLVFWVVFAVWLRSFLSAIVPQSAFRSIVSFELIGLVLVLATIASLMAAAPTWMYIARERQISSISGQLTFSSGPKAVALQRILVAGQVAATVLLLATSAEALQSVRRWVSAGRLPEQHRVFVKRIEMRARKAESQLLEVNASRLQQEVQLRGAERVALVAGAPVGDTGRSFTWLNSSTAHAQAQLVHATAEYFSALRADVIAGSTFSGRESERTQPVMVVGKLFARFHWGGRSGLGQEVQLDGEAGKRVVVGIVEDLPFLSREPQPTIYLPLMQPYRGIYQSEMDLIYRAPSERNLDVAFVDALVRRDAFWKGSGGPSQTLESLMSAGSAGERAQTLLLLIMSISALCVAMAGVYSIVSRRSYTRRHEMGIRMAIGASAASIFWEIASEGVWIGLWGTALGLVLSRAVLNVMGSAVYGVKELEVSSLVVSGGLTLVIFACAIAIPALSAARVSPLVSLRTIDVG